MWKLVFPRCRQKYIAIVFKMIPPRVDWFMFKLMGVLKYSANLCQSFASNRWWKKKHLLIYGASSVCNGIDIIFQNDTFGHELFIWIFWTKYYLVVVNVVYQHNLLSICVMDLLGVLIWTQCEMLQGNCFQKQHGRQSSKQCQWFLSDQDKISFNFFFTFITFERKNPTYG